MTDAPRDIRRAQFTLYVVDDDSAVRDALSRRGQKTGLDSKRDT